MLDCSRVILLWFQNPILVNKKKAADIQFYTEVGSQTDDLDQRRGYVPMIKKLS